MPWAASPGTAALPLGDPGAVEQPADRPCPAAEGQAAGKAVLEAWGTARTGSTGGWQLWDPHPRSAVPADGRRGGQHSTRGKGRRAFATGPDGRGKSERRVPTPGQTAGELGRGEAGACGCGQRRDPLPRRRRQRCPARRLAGSIREVLLPPHVLSQ